jgi:hypothetical protein
MPARPAGPSPDLDETRGRRGRGWAAPARFGEATLSNAYTAEDEAVSDIARGARADLFLDRKGGVVDVAFDCRQCGTSVTGRFCTSCGAPATGSDAVVDPVPPQVAEAHTHLPSAPTYDASSAVHGAESGGALEIVGFSSVAVADDTGGLPPWATLPSRPGGQWAASGSRTRQAWRSVLALLVIGSLGLSAWVLMHGTERHVLSGTVLLVDSSSELAPGDQCGGTGGFGDINGGAPVVLTDGEGATLSTTVLSDGEFDGEGCVFSFVLPDVRHTDFYALAVAGSNRGQLQYSYAQMAQNSWSVQLSLGDH